MQVSWSLLGSIVLLLVINLAIYLFRKLRNKRAKRKAIALTKEALFLANCSKYAISVRETEVLRLILEGLTYKEVGEKLFISEKTVDSHMQNIYAKVGVRNKLSLWNKLYS